jgi:hypothetical protein
LSAAEDTDAALNSVSELSRLGRILAKRSRSGIEARAALLHRDLADELDRLLLGELGARGVEPTSLTSAGVLVIASANAARSRGSKKSLSLQRRTASIFMADAPPLLLPTAFRMVRGPTEDPLRSADRRSRPLEICAIE